ncbi:hypothetical protein GW17_00034059 [Ensete ventricosum]|nr:hypothetical protein GW17_00034059 [Ensete ventricosum]RZS03224.1 hypothetical protein BHM03_00033368 [Ensete ventricosum]
MINFIMNCLPGFTLAFIPPMQKKKLIFLVLSPLEYLFMLLWLLAISGCIGKKLGPTMWRRPDSVTVPEEIYQVLDGAETDQPTAGSDVPQTLEEFIAEMKKDRTDAKTFALRLRAMVSLLEQKTRVAKIQEYLYRHVASSSIPKPLHCLALRLAQEHSTNVGARHQLPAPERVPALVDPELYHFVLASDNVLAAAVVAASLVANALRPGSVVLHVITDRKTYAPMQAWFSLHPLAPAVVEVKALHHFDWFTRGRVPVLEAMEKDRAARSHFRGGSSAIVANVSEKPIVVAAKLQALSPKYHSLFPSLNKVVFLDDDVVVQADLSPLWDIDLRGKVNGLIAFHGHVHVIDPYWHMLGLGYQENTTVEDAEKAAVIHFNGRAKPWLDIAFPEIRHLWAKYLSLSDKFIRACNIRA